MRRGESITVTGELFKVEVKFGSTWQERPVVFFSRELKRDFETTETIFLNCGMISEEGKRFYFHSPRHSLFRQIPGLSKETNWFFKNAEEKIKKGDKITVQAKVRHISSKDYVSLHYVQLVDSEPIEMEEVLPDRKSILSKVAESFEEAFKKDEKKLDKRFSIFNNGLHESVERENNNEKES